MQINSQKVNCFRSDGVVVAETNTNPIDRSMVHLLFYRPPNTLPSSANGEMSHDSHSPVSSSALFAAYWYPFLFSFYWLCFCESIDRLMALVWRSQWCRIKLMVLKMQNTDRRPQILPQMPLWCKLIYSGIRLNKPQLYID